MDKIPVEEIELKYRIKCRWKHDCTIERMLKFLQRFMENPITKNMAV